MLHSGCWVGGIELGLEGHSAIAMSLFVVGATSLAGLVAHARRGRVQWRTGLVFGGAGMLGAYLAGRVARFIAAELLLVGFSLMMFAALLLDAELRIALSTEEASQLLGFELPLGVPAAKVLCGKSPQRPLALALSEGRAVRQ